MEATQTMHAKLTPSAYASGALDAGEQPSPMLNSSATPRLPADAFAQDGAAAEREDGEASLSTGSDSDIFDLMDIDLSFPKPGTDTRSNASPFEFKVGQHVFWATREGEKHGIVEHVAITDYMLDNPSPDLVGASPAPHTNVHIPRKIRGRLSDPYYIVRDDAHKQLAFKYWELTTIRSTAGSCYNLPSCAPAGVACGVGSAAKPRKSDSV